MVEEGPAKTPSAGASAGQSRDETESEKEETEEEEEESYDIDDLSGQESSASSTSNTSTGQSSPSMSPRDQAAEQAAAVAAAKALSHGTPHAPHPGTHLGGIESPDRFATGHHPHPPRMSPRHAHFSDTPFGQNGDRDEIYSGRVAHTGTRSRIPRDRDVDGESLRTPRALDASPMRRGGENGRRAFAVWGHDESDSNASDSDTN